VECSYERRLEFVDGRWEFSKKREAQATAKEGLISFCVVVVFGI
jgi:hypothetical protein